MIKIIFKGDFMSEKIKQIARRLKELREISGLSVESLAQDLKITTTEYQNYENGLSDIPVSFLLEVANKFKVELTALLTGEEPRLEGYSLVRKGKGINVERRQEYKYNDLAYNFKHKKAEIFLVTAEPGNAEPHYYAHPGQEFSYVLEGVLKVLLDGHEITLQEGDAFYFDSGKKHAVQAVGDKPVKFLAVIL